MKNISKNQLKKIIDLVFDCLETNKLYVTTNYCNMPENIMKLIIYEYIQNGNIEIYDEYIDIFWVKQHMNNSNIITYKDFIRNLLNRKTNLNVDAFFNENEKNLLYDIINDNIIYPNPNRVSTQRQKANKYISKQKIRKYIFNRDNNECVKCGTSDNLTIDHIIPVSKGGNNANVNLQTLCRSCNSKKRNNDNILFMESK